MIKPQSNLKEYSLIYSGDPALRLPEDEAERERVLHLAQDTGDWKDLLGGEEEPTVFEVYPLKGSQFDWWIGECKRRELVTLEANTLALRLALKAVHNFGAHKVERRKHPEYGGVVLATIDIIDALYAEAGGAGRELVLELGNAVVERAQNPLRPKS